jgi:hypothetical protein
VQRNFLFWSGLARLGTNTDNRTAKVGTPKHKKNAPAGESGNQRRKRRKEKLIRLDDLIPKQDVTGGVQLPFGAPDNPNNKQP